VSAPSPDAPASAVGSPLRNPNFRLLLGYRTATTLSYQIVAVTVGWQIYEITRNPWMLGLIGLAEVLPYFCVAPFAGHLVDHLPRRRLAMLTSLGLALTPLLLIAITLIWTPTLGVWPIYVAIMLTGGVRAFLIPTYNAIFANVLARHQYVRGASLGSIVLQSGMVVGPALGGVIIGFAGEKAAYGLAVVFALIAMTAMSRLRVIQTPPTRFTPVLRSIGEGARFVFGHQLLLAALALDMFAVMFGGAISLAPAFLREILDGGPEGLGILRGAPALGAVVTGLWLAHFPLKRNEGRVLLYAVAGFGLCMVGFGLSSLFWLSALFLLFSGICDGVSVVLRSTIMQLSTPDAMRGRVASINGLFIGSSNEIGAFYAGSMARLLGLVPAVVLGGFVTTGVVAVTAWRAPRLRRLNLSQLSSASSDSPVIAG